MAPIRNNTMLEQSFESSDELKKLTPSKEELDSLNLNLLFLNSYFKKVLPGQQVSVPFAIFLDKTTGKVTHVQGLTEKPILDLMFGANSQ